MEQYIPKSAVVAEIDRLENKLYYEPENFKDVGAKMALDSLKSSLETIEVKEVDLEKELDSMITPELKFHKALPSLFDVAKHFFELGLKAQKGEEV